MGADQHFDWSAAAASALDWWREAGVDTLVEDAPRDWLAPPRPVAAPASAAPARMVPAPGAAAMPEAWEAFAAWRTGADAPEGGWSGPRIAAEGPIGAELMVLLDIPDREDCAAGRLLTGAAGRLFDRMLAAIGEQRERIHLASVCTARPPAGRVTPEVEARLAAVTLRHVALTAPKRLLLMGNAASRAALATECPAARGRLHVINHEEGKVTAVATFHPRFLLDRPAAKAEAWRDLQLLMGDRS